MTAIENYSSTSTSLQDEYSNRNQNDPTPATSDDRIKARPPRPSTAAISQKRIPPAVPSPPPLSSRTSPHPPRGAPQPQQKSPKPPRSTSSRADMSNQWFFTEAEVNNTPSVADGLQLIEEHSRRAKGVNFITQAGIVLKLPQLTIATASVFFHRFYMRYSMVPEKGGLHHYNIAATALFLATKTEENCRKTKEIVIAVAKVAQKNSNLIIDEQSKEYWRWRDNILLYEELMLELLTFDVVIESPYNYLYSVLHSLDLDTNKPLRNAAWGWVCDSCLTMMCLLMPPRDIAIAAIYFAAKYTREKIPDDDRGEAWWVREGGSEQKIRLAVAVMHEFYSENPLKKTEQQSPYYRGERGEEDLDSTRRPAGESPSSGSQNGQSQGSTSKLNEANGNGSLSSQDKLDLLAEDTPSQGDSDARLKAIANDPATHQANGHSNGVSELLRSTNSGPSPKRRIDDHEERVSKRLKTDAPMKEGVDMAGADQDEGELEE